MKLPYLKPGAGIGLFAPAGSVREADIQPGIDVLEAEGFSVKTVPHLFDSFRYFSGTVSRRMANLNALLNDPAVDVLYAVRGGVGSAQLLPEIDFAAWQNRGKLLTGFSDVTALQWGVWAKTGVPSLSGMTLTSQLRPENPFLPLFFRILTGKTTSIRAEDITPGELTIRREGTAEGILLGGTLSIITTLLGTPYFSVPESIVLFLEDINEPAYRLERSLVQLKQAGVLNRVSGLLLGKFKTGDKFLNIWQDMAYLFPERIPVVDNFPYGHFARACPLPLGVAVKFTAQPFGLFW